MSALSALIFLGGWGAPFAFFADSTIWFVLKILLVLFVFVWVRATNPRYRYDQLMYVGWKVLLPLSLAWLVFISSILFVTDSLPILCI
jgi:NADH-quinone oxidoreductase subunit H